MISICCCSSYSKEETETFIRTLALTNPSGGFEVCLVHDNRVNDNSKEYFERLQAEFSFLKVKESTWDDARNYLDLLTKYYDLFGLFSAEFRSHIKSNMKKDFPFLWLSSGWLYNQAVEMSTGGTLIICPSDYLFLFNLLSLEQHVISRAHDDLFYGKLNGLRFPLCNTPVESVIESLDSESIGDFRSWKNPSYLKRFHERPDKLFTIDLRNKTPIYVDENLVPNMKPVLEFEYKNKHQRMLQGVHGLHVMTKKTYNQIGGFTEEWYGRAWSDDKMTSLGVGKYSKGWLLPPEYSFLWCEPFVKNVEASPQYLHDGFDSSYINSLPGLFDRVFKNGSIAGRLSPPVRIIK